MAPVVTPVKIKEKKKRGNHPKAATVEPKLEALPKVSANGSATPDRKLKANSEVPGNQLQNIGQL